MNYLDYLGLTMSHVHNSIVNMMAMPDFDENDQADKDNDVEAVSNDHEQEEAEERTREMIEENN